MDQDGAAASHRQGRALMADDISRHRGAIVRRWLDRVTLDIQRSGRKVEPTDLRDGIEDYLLRLASCLRSEGDLGAVGAEAWRQIAREHAITGLRDGFDISQLVRELILLRESIFEVLAGAGAADAIDARQADHLASLINAAIAAAVESYVQARNYAARGQRAQHVRFITHELRNPLTTAKLAASQLRRPGSVQLVAGSLRALDALDRSLERLRQLIENLLLTDRMDSGDIQCDPVDVPLGAILDGALAAPSRDARAKGLQLHLRYDPDLMLHVDPGLAISAVQNVVDNAVKFTEQGSVEIDVENRGGEVAIHVLDGCAGLSPEELRTIFDPSGGAPAARSGSEAARSAKAGRSGGGLGLAIARRAVEAQGGAITAASSEHGGCHFCLTLPKSRH
jgi:signal transduction histidine kinase